MTAASIEKKVRFQYVDMVRGIAMICIIIGHLKEPSINRVVFTFHVPIFYFITGFFLSDKKDTLAFIKNKARTLLVPYAVTCGVMILVGTLIGLHNGNAGEPFLKWLYASVYGAGDTYNEPFYIKGIGAIWFLWATFWGSVFLRISLKFNKYVRIAFIIGLFVAGFWSRELCWFPLSIQAGACATLFMYMGFLLKRSKDVLSGLSVEVKTAGIIAAAFIWLQFIVNFKSFWLVHCDIGRGVIDVLGCICACALVTYVSFVAEKKNFFLVRPLAIVGKYSLLVLCIHIVELSFVPWSRMTDILVSHGMPAQLELAFVITSKLVLIFVLAFLLTKLKPVRIVMNLGR